MTLERASRPRQGAHLRGYLVLAVLVAYGMWKPGTIALSSAHRESPA
jgi:hypothetical protein